MFKNNEETQNKAIPSLGQASLDARLRGSLWIHAAEAPRSAFI